MPQITLPGGGVQAKTIAELIAGAPANSSVLITTRPDDRYVSVIVRSKDATALTNYNVYANGRKRPR